MGKVTGFMEFERLEQAHEPVAQRKRISASSLLR